MIGLPILEVAIGVSFVYLLLALICSAVNEALADLTRRRAAMLDKGIERMLGDASLKAKLYQHPLIQGLSEGKHRMGPSYIPNDTFALALMDIVTGPNKPANDAAALREGLTGPHSPPFKQALTAVLQSSGPQPNDQKKIEDWYDKHMQRVSGWYKRKTQYWIWGLAAAVTLVANADTVRITRTLWANPVVRSAVVESAKVRAQMDRPEEMVPLVEYTDPENPEASTPVKIQKDQALTDQERALLGQLMGWSQDLATLRRPGATRGSEARWFLVHGFGWFLTIVAVSLGAPFWFDMLKRFMNVRMAGQVPGEQRDKGRPSGS